MSGKPSPQKSRRRRSTPTPESFWHFLLLVIDEKPGRTKNLVKLIATCSVVVVVVFAVLLLLALEGSGTSWAIAGGTCVVPTGIGLAWRWWRRRQTTK
jgi:protein-S-isoprenylcysteine O-methyltransferase Ste14